MKKGPIARALEFKTVVPAALAEQERLCVEAGETAWTCNSVPLTKFMSSCKSETFSTKISSCCVSLAAIYENWSVHVFLGAGLSSRKALPMSLPLIGNGNAEVYYTSWCLMNV